MDLVTFLNIAGPANGLDWNNPRHQTALVTVQQEYYGTALHREVAAGEPRAFVRMLEAVRDKVQAAAHLQACLDQDNQGGSGRWAKARA